MKKILSLLLFVLAFNQASSQHCYTNDSLHICLLEYPVVYVQTIEQADSLMIVNQEKPFLRRVGFKLLKGFPFVLHGRPQPDNGKNYLMPNGNRYTYADLISTYPSLNNQSVFQANFK